MHDLSEFEIRDTNNIRRCVTVLETFIHPYTGGTMRRIRLKGASDITAYTVVNEQQFNNLILMRIM